MPARRERIPGEQWPQSIILWNSLSERIFNYLNDVTLAEAVNQQQAEKSEKDTPYRSGYEQSAA